MLALEIVEIRAMIIMHAMDLVIKNSMGGAVKRTHHFSLRGGPLAYPRRETFRTLAHVREGQASSGEHNKGFFISTAGNSLLIRIEFVWGATLPSWGPARPPNLSRNGSSYSQFTSLGEVNFKKFPSINQHCACNSSG